MKIELINKAKTETFEFELKYNGRGAVFYVVVTANEIENIWYDHNDEGHQHDFVVRDLEDLEVAAGLLKEIRKIRKGII